MYCHIFVEISVCDVCILSEQTFALESFVCVNKVFCFVLSIYIFCLCLFKYIFNCLF